MAEKLKIKIRYFSDDIPRLKQIYPGEWIDISCPNDIVLLKNQPLLINLGFAMELPNDYEAIMAQRSSTYLKYGTILTNGIGVIDNSYKGNNDQWKALVYATQDDMDNAISNVTNTLTTKINTDVGSVNTALTNHINNKSNPHTVTKEQVGLGNVNNYGLASQSEAQNGSVDNKYMTPLKTKQAIEYYGIISDGNVILKIGGTQPAVQAGKTIIWIDTSS